MYEWSRGGIDPIPGGPFRAWHNPDVGAHATTSGMPSGSLANTVDIRSDDWGFVAGQDTDGRLAGHGGSSGNVVLIDASVTQINRPAEFQQLGMSHAESAWGGTLSGRTYGTWLMIHSPW